MVASVAPTRRSSAVVDHWIAAAGSSAARPPATSAAAISDEVRHRHEQHERAGHLRQRLPPCPGRGARRIVVAARDGDGAGDAPVGHRDARHGGPGDRAAHARDHLESKARLRQGEGLLAAAAEDERVAALEAHHAPPGAGVLHQHRADLLLRHPVAPGRLAGVDQDGVGRGEVQQPLGSQAIVDHDLGRLQQTEPADGQQVGIARAGADEVNDAAHAGTTVPRYCSMRSRAPSRSPGGEPVDDVGREQPLHRGGTLGHGEEPLLELLARRAQQTRRARPTRGRSRLRCADARPVRRRGSRRPSRRRRPARRGA